MAYTVHLYKTRFKFSSSHFTIFGKDKAEALHGHNYRVRVKMSFNKADEKTGLCVSFDSVKAEIDKLCEKLDEQVLLPNSSPYLQFETVGNQVKVHFGKKEYTFPVEDCVFLPVVNISSEMLAFWFWQELAKALEGRKEISKLAVSIMETQGQAVTFEDALPS